MRRTAVAMVLLGLVPVAAQAFPIAWEADITEQRDGYRLYRHAGPCADPIKQWKLINTYPADALSGEATPPKPPAMRCYTLRAFKNYPSGTVESEDSNLVQRMPSAPTGLKEVKP